MLLSFRREIVARGRGRGERRGRLTLIVALEINDHFGTTPNAERELPHAFPRHRLDHPFFPVALGLSGSALGGSGSLER